jgi:hypothetical protein
MKATIVFTLCICSAVSFGQESGSPTGIPATTNVQTTHSEGMTNADVIELCSLGLSDDVVVQKIGTSKAVAFDTSITGLKELKAAKVSDAVIRAMLTQESTIAANSPEADISTFHSTDGKVRVYVTDHPMDEVTSIIRGSSASAVRVDRYSARGGSVSSVGGVSHGQVGDDPRTVEIQADIEKVCPAYVLVSDNPARADYILIFRREGGKRSSFFAFGGLTGLAISAASKVDGSSLFQPNGDMIFATREKTVQTAIRVSCLHIPAPQLAPVPPSQAQAQ